MSAIGLGDRNGMVWFGMVRHGLVCYGLSCVVQWVQADTFLRYQHRHLRLHSKKGEREREPSNANTIKCSNTIQLTGPLPKCRSACKRECGGGGASWLKARDE